MKWIFYRVGKEGSAHHKWERDTWPALKEIAEKYPEAGIHFRGMISPQNLVSIRPSNKI